VALWRAGKNRSPRLEDYGEGRDCALGDWRRQHCWANTVSPLGPRCRAIWDALTTVLSVIAQYLQTKKVVESWHVDYRRCLLHRPVSLQESRSHRLAVSDFLIMCIIGVREWQASLTNDARAAALQPQTLAE